MFGELLIANFSNSTGVHGVLMIGTMDDSPSKDLAEGLKSFHISSPGGKNDMDQLGNNKINFKQYLPNNEFADSKFLSYVGDSNSRTYVKKLGDWSMSYGTVQQKPKSRSPVDTSPANYKRKKEGALDDKNLAQHNDENVEPPQFKQYLQNNNQKQVQLDHTSRGAESDLILTASLNDISGIPTNTFKRHTKKKLSPHDSDLQNMIGTRAAQEEMLNGSNLTDDGGDEEDDDDDVDPALEARGVFDNILRNQKSNYEFNKNEQIESQLHSEINKERSISETGSSSYFGETPSSLSPNFEVDQDLEPVVKMQKKKKPSSGMGLIKPEDVGLVFSNVDGVWYKPPARNQDISSSRTTDNTFGNNFDSNNSITPAGVADPVVPSVATERANAFIDGARVGPAEIGLTTALENLTKSKHQKKRSITTSITSRLSPGDKKNPAGFVIHEEQEGEEEEEYDDTPLDIPQINPRYMPVAGTVRNKKNNLDAITDEEVKNDSNNVNKKELVKLLTEVIPPLQSDWVHVTRINLSGKKLEKLNGLNELLPSLIELDVSVNDIVDLNGVPIDVMCLNLSHNQITTNYCDKHLSGLVHLESLNLSHNKLDYNLSFLSTLKHLHTVDLSFNSINSIDDNLGISRIRKLNLSHNNIAGIIDFEKVLKYNSNVYCNRSICWLTVEELDLSNNGITEIRNTSMLKNLRVLNLDSNPIASMTDAEDHKSLRTLSITNTSLKLKKIDIHRYKLLRKLKIDLHDDVMQGWTSSTLPPELEELHVENGSLHQLPEWSVIPPTLHGLTLRNVKGLKELPPNLTGQLPVLKELDLTNNEFASWFRVIERIPTKQLCKLTLVGNPLVRGLGREDVDRLYTSIQLICPKIKDIALYDEIAV